MITLDHAGLVAPDLSALQAEFAALGFTLTPLARQSGRLRADGPVEPWGTANRCAMLPDGGYIELLGILDPALPANGLDRFLARHAGLHILALGMEDEDAELARLHRAGLDIPGVLHLHRPVDSTDPDGPQARFARLPIPEAPEGRLQLVRHLTPELLWQDRWTAHPNRALALDSILLAAVDPADSAARLSRLAGQPVRPDPAGGYALALARGTVRILPPDALNDLLPGFLPPALPAMVAITVRTADAAAAIRTLRPDLRDTPLGFATIAGGAVIAFR